MKTHGSVATLNFRLDLPSLIFRPYRTPAGAEGRLENYAEVLLMYDAFYSSWVRQSNISFMPRAKYEILIYFFNSEMLSIIQKIIIPRI